MDLIWRSEKKIKSGADLIGDFCHFAPIAPHFLPAKIYPNKVSELNKGVNTEAAAQRCSIAVLKNQKQPLEDALQYRCS